MALNTYLIAGGIALAVIAILPFALPSSKRVERAGFVPALPEAVFALVSTTSGFQTFNPYKDADANLKIKPFGPDAGIGAGFAFEGKDATGTQTIIALAPNQSVTMQIDLGPMGKPVQTFTLSPEKDGTRVVWATERAFGYNPVGRVFGLFMDGYLGPTYERGLAKLAKAAGSKS
jgi:hypothetical protein